MINLDLKNEQIMYGSNSRNIAILLDGSMENTLELLKKNRKKMDLISLSIEDFIKINDLDSLNLMANADMKDYFENLFKNIKNNLSSKGSFVLHVRDKNSLLFKELLVKVFGYDNYITTFLWDNTRNNQNLTTKINDSVEYFYTFAKNNKEFNINQQKFSVVDDKSYNLQDSYVNTKGKYKLLPLDTNSFEFSEDKGKPVIINDYICHAGGSEKETRKKIWTWLWDKEKIKDGYEKGIVVIKKDNKRNPRLFKKQYQFADDDGNEIVRKVNYKNLILNTNNNTTKQEFESNTEIKATNIIAKDVFKHILQALTDNDSNVLELNSIYGSLCSSVIEVNSDLNASRTAYVCSIDVFSQNIIKHLKTKNLDNNTPFNKHNTKVDFSLFYFELSVCDSPIDEFNIDSQLEHTIKSNILFNLSAFSKPMFNSDSQKTVITHNKDRSIVICFEPFPKEDNLAILRDFSNIKYNNLKPILISYESFLCDSAVNDLELDVINMLDFINN